MKKSKPFSSGGPPLLGSFHYNRPMNLYDDDRFFSSYIALRNEANYNDLMETPAMLSLLGAVKGKRIIDLGCGFGSTACVLADMGASYVLGIDISEKMIKKAKAEHQHSCVEYRVMDMVDVSDIEERFDIAYSSLAFHYIEDLGRLLQGIRSILADGGMLIFSQEHPISTADYEGGFSPDGSSYTFSSYQKEGKRVSRWFVDGVTTYHRTFGTIANTLIQNGYSIDTVLEPKPSNTAMKILPRLIMEYEKPSFLIIKSYQK